MILNGGLETKAQIATEITGFAGVMLGRAAYRTPYVLTEIANDVFGATPPSRRQVAEAMADYADRMMSKSCAASQHNTAYAGALCRPTWCQTLAPPIG